MNKKEKMELILSKVPESQKEAFIAELRAADTKEAREELAKKYQITLAEEEKAAIRAETNSRCTIISLTGTK